MVYFLNTNCCSYLLTDYISHCVPIKFGADNILQQVDIVYNLCGSLLEQYKT